MGIYFAKSATRAELRRGLLGRRPKVVLFDEKGRLQEQPKLSPRDIAQKISFMDWRGRTRLISDSQQERMIEHCKKTIENEPKSKTAFLVKGYQRKQIDPQTGRLYLYDPKIKRYYLTNQQILSPYELALRRTGSKEKPTLLSDATVKKLPTFFGKPASDAIVTKSLLGRLQVILVNDLGEALPKIGQPQQLSNSRISYRALKDRGITFLRSDAETNGLLAYRRLVLRDNLIEGYLPEEIDTKTGRHKETGLPILSQYELVLRRILGKDELLSDLERDKFPNYFGKSAAWAEVIRSPSGERIRLYNNLGEILPLPLSEQPTPSDIRKRIIPRSKLISEDRFIASRRSRQSV